MTDDDYYKVRSDYSSGTGTTFKAALQKMYRTINLSKLGARSRIVMGGTIYNYVGVYRFANLRGIKANSTTHIFYLTGMQMSDTLTENLYLTLSFTCTSTITSSFTNGSDSTVTSSMEFYY